MASSTLSSQFTKANCTSGIQRWLKCSALVAFALTVGVGPVENRAAADSKPALPNILLLLTDDHCYRALGCAGNRVVKTPNIDRLAAEGVYFTHCFTPMPQCSPSRAALLTGQDTWTNRVGKASDPFATNSVLWPRLLRAAGYDTFYTGKWHNFGMPWDYGFDQGENIYSGGMSDHHQIRLLQWKQPKSARKLANGFSSTLFADSAIRFLKGRKSERPFCAYVSFTAPHDPWTPPDEYAQMYDAASVDLPPNFMPRPPFRLPEKFLDLRDQQVLPFPRTESDARQALALYYGMISHLDHEIGRILLALEQQGLAESTLVIIAGDHGHSLASHGFVGKQCMYEEGIRLPLILRYPRVIRGAATCDALVSLIDVFPTICEAAGVTVPDAVEGRSLMPFYKGKPAKRRDHTFASHHSPEKHGMSTHCIRTERYKLIEHRTTGELEMFDLSKDPFELKNLADDLQMTAVRMELHEKLSRWAANHEPVSATK